MPIDDTTINGLRRVKAQLASMNLSIDDLRLLLNSNAADIPRQPTPLTVGEQQKNATAGPFRPIPPQRACKQCRQQKTKCVRVDNADECVRCAKANLECIVTESKRGRVRGSKNKHKGLEKSLVNIQKALSLINEEDTPDGSDRLPRKRLRTSSPVAGAPSTVEDSTSQPSIQPTISFDPPHHTTSPTSPYTASTDAEHVIRLAAELPMESTRGTPELEAPADENIHPLRLINNVGSSALDPTPPNRSDRPMEQTGITGWSREALSRALERKRIYFRYSNGARKRDIGIDLEMKVDPLIASFLRERFFAILQPQIGFLDPELHDMNYLRSRSALLYTAILSVAARALCSNGNDDLVSLSARLQAHTERLLLTVILCNARSPELVQALLILSLWPPCPVRDVDDRSGSLLALAIHMAVDLNLHLHVSREHGSETETRRDRDITRTWLTCLIQDRSASAFTGRPPTIVGELDLEGLHVWAQAPLATPGDQMLVGFLELRSIQREMRQRLDAAFQPYLRDGVRQGALLLLERWIANWCTPANAAAAPLMVDVMRFLAHHVQLSFYTSASNSGTDSFVRDGMCKVAQESLEHIVRRIGPNAKYLCRTVCAMISWAAVILFRKSREASIDLIRQLALCMAPSGDLGDNHGYPYFYGSFLLTLIMEEQPPVFPHLSAPEPSPDSLLAALQDAVGNVNQSNHSSLSYSGFPLQDLWANTQLSTASTPFRLSHFPMSAVGGQPLPTVHDSTWTTNPLSDERTSGTSQSTTAIPPFTQNFDLPVWEGEFVDRSDRLLSMDWLMSFASFDQV